MVYNVFDIANKLLVKASNQETGDLMSNLKLQKMLYFEQGYHLAYFGTPLFEDDIEAWMYGPVVPCVYNHYKSNGRVGIEPHDHDAIRLAQDEEELFNDVFMAYSEFSAYGLMRKTHEEGPWCDTPQKEVISKDSMQKYFKTLLA